MQWPKLKYRFTQVSKLVNSLFIIVLPYIYEDFVLVMNFTRIFKPDCSPGQSHTILLIKIKYAGFVQS